MDKSENSIPLEPSNPTVTFFRGFFIRLFYGSLALPFIALVRPDFFGELFGLFSTSFAFYLIICVAGGFYDVETRERRKTEFKLFVKPTVKDVLLFAAVLFFLWSLRK